MKTVNWREEFPAAITVTDKDDIIIEMNQKAADLFSKDGGKALIGKDLLDCHSHLSQEKIKKIQAGKNPNIYTIQKNDIKKMVFQAPYFENGRYAGLVEISFELPAEVPHFNRDMR
ncbi:MAG: PAS domain-containing protein [Chloroflexi bacterium]|nr:PAS domain-containing protein [Chloroflexota bacterium]